VLPLTENYNVYLKPIAPGVVAHFRKELRVQQVEKAREVESVGAVAAGRSGRKVGFAKMKYLEEYRIERGARLRKVRNEKYDLTEKVRDTLQMRLQAALERAQRLEADFASAAKPASVSNEVRAAAAGPKSESADVQTAATAQSVPANVVAMEEQKGAAAVGRAGQGNAPARHLRK
jgi:hypothetical protein